mmetsp:Transcript_1650/g.3539  ORF Transcript_1650/g.3539 Transcript_1650/m.3539 type:complete len:105 (-) Transcript_1650:226-540(-)
MAAALSQNVPDPVPPDYICPITQELMRDPVSALDGHSYEREAITQWFEQGRIESPLTNAPLGSTQLIPNYTLRKGECCPCAVKITPASLRATHPHSPRPASRGQ